MIKEFRITKLFGFRNVDISFEDNTKILIGENGLGKTTVLNALYYILTQEYFKLSQIEFEDIELIFKNNKKIYFTNEEIKSYLSFIKRGRHISKRHFNILDIVDLDDLKQYVDKNTKNSKNRREIIIDYVQQNPELNMLEATSMITKEILAFLNDKRVKKFDKYSAILKEFDFTILYFPTYRRVEEDLKNIGKIRKKNIPGINRFSEEFFIEEFEGEPNISEDTLIHFGMEDVKRRISDVEEKINKSTMSGFSKVTGEMLSQLSEGYPDIKDTEIEQLDISTAKIVLDRVGDNLSKTDRKNIISLLDKKDNLKQKKELVYFLFKLIDIYKQHKHIDDAIKQFRDVCNRYLEDKQFKYNESSVTIRIYREQTEEEVPLDKLSSGEKQIVSLFSRIYLGDKDNLFVLFDEPELSLSIEWQKQLLPDIVKSGKCKFLLAVTHSPFIFKNELDQYAVGMNVYVKHYTR